MGIMTPNHPRWDDFCQELEGENGCNFREDSFNWDCKGGYDKSKTEKILKNYNVNIQESLKYFEEHGGHCDCEILFNVAKY
jgi:hypothetical protein